MSQREQSLLVYSYSITKESLINLGNFLKTYSTSLLEKLEPKLAPLRTRISPYIEVSKEFYEEHKLIILVLGAVTITYLIVKPAKTEQSKDKKKRVGTVKRQVGNKTFISDNSQAENQEDPSTGTRREVESSGREFMQKKKVENKFLQRIQSSSEEEESGDKIFFQVYKTYQGSGTR